MKLSVPYGSRPWLKLLLASNPGMRLAGAHDGLLVVTYEGETWKVLGGSPMRPHLRQIIFHDFGRPA